MSEENKKKIPYSDLPEGIRKLISTAAGRGIIKYFSEHPETLQTAIKASELRRIAADRIHSDPVLQEKIQKIALRIASDPKIQQDFFKARKQLSELLYLVLLAILRSMILSYKILETPWD